MGNNKYKNKLKAKPAIGKINEYSYLSYLIPLLLLVLSANVWYLNYSLNFKGFNVYTSDAMSYANMAVHFLEGKGFTLNITFPVELSLLDKDPLTPFVTSRYPYLYPFFLSIFFKIFGVTSFAMVLASGGAYILLVGASYFLAKRLFDTKVGVFSALFIMFNNEMLNYSVSGLTEPLFIFLLLTSIYFIFFGENKRGILLAGIFYGLVQSTRLVGFVFTFPLLLLIFLKEDDEKVKKTLLFFISSSLISLPVYYINYKYYGNILGATPKYYFLYKMVDGLPWHQVIKVLSDFVDPTAFLIKNYSMFISKITYNLNFQLEAFIAGKVMPVVYILCSAFSIILLKGRSERKLLLAAVYLLMLLQLLINCTTFVVYRYFHPFIPFLVIFSVGLVFYLIDKYHDQIYIRGAFSISLIAAFILLFPFKPGDVSFAETKKAREYTDNWTEKLGDFIQSNTKASGVIVSDVPWLTGWYGRRPSIWLPATPEIFDEMDKKILKVDYLFLSPDYTLQGWENKHWQTLYISPKKWNGFVPYKLFKYGTYKAILYKRETTNKF